jgi:hypothetical protein
MIKHYCGIDTGLKGAVCIVNTHGKIVLLKDWDEIPSIDFNKYEDTLYLIEETFNTPQLSGKSIRTTAYNSGWIAGLLHGRRVKTIHPRTWKAFYKLSKNKEDGLIVAMRNHQETSIFYEKKTFKDGRLEAYLLAEYCRVVVGMIIKITEANHGKEFSA